jgi:predicted permease
MLERILGIILPVYLIVLLGYLYGRRVKPDMTAVNRINMNVLMPALIFSALSSKEFELLANWKLLIGSVGVVVGSGLIAWPIARYMRFDPRTLVPPVMFNNCGNTGLPLAALAYGAAGFGPMVALFTISNLLHFTLGVWIIRHDAKFSNLLRNPMVWSTVAGFAFALTHPPLPGWLSTAIKLIGDAMVPMILLSLGVRLADVRWADVKIGVVGGIACPAAGLAVALVLAPLLDLDATQRGLLILFGGLPPAVLNFMVAEAFRQEPHKVASIVMIGNVLSVVFVPIALTLALHPGS